MCKFPALSKSVDIPGYPFQIYRPVHLGLHSDLTYLCVATGKPLGYMDAYASRTVYRVRTINSPTNRWYESPIAFSYWKPRNVLQVS